MHQCSTDVPDIRDTDVTIWLGGQQRPGEDVGIHAAMRRICTMAEGGVNR